MTIVQETAVIVGVIALITYPLIMMALARWVHPTRLRMADLSKILIDSPHLQPNHKKMVALMATDAFSAMDMVVCSVAMPLVIAGILRGAKSPFEPVKDEKTLEMLTEFTGCHMRSATAANPLFAIIVGLEFAVVSFVLVPIGYLETLVDIQIRAVSRIEDIMHKRRFSAAT